MKVEHLGSSTGEAYSKVFKRQSRGRKAHKSMESEIGVGVTKKMTRMDAAGTSPQRLQSLVRPGG